MVHYGIHYTRTINEDDFSLGAAFDQFRRQTSSGGSWLLSGAINKHNIKTDQSLIPDSISDKYSSIKDLRSADLLTFSIGGGYGHCFTLKNYYFSILINTAIAEQKQILKFLSKEENKWEITTKTNINMSFGYNGKINYGGLTALYETTNMPLKKSELNFSTNQILLFMGRRFHDFY